MANGTPSTSNALTTVSSVQTTLSSLLSALEILPAVRADLRSQLADQRRSVLTTVAQDLVAAKGDRAGDDAALEKYRAATTNNVDKLEKQIAALKGIEEALLTQVTELIQQDGAEVVASLRQRIRDIESRAEQEERDARNLKTLLAEAEENELDRLTKNFYETVERPQGAAMLRILRERLGTTADIEAAREHLEQTIATAVGSVHSDLSERFGRRFAEINHRLTILSKRMGVTDSAAAAPVGSEREVTPRAADSADMASVLRDAEGAKPNSGRKRRNGQGKGSRRETTTRGK